MELLITFLVTFLAMWTGYFIGKSYKMNDDSCFSKDSLHDTLTEADIPFNSPNLTNCCEKSNNTFLNYKTTCCNKDIDIDWSKFPQCITLKDKVK